MKARFLALAIVFNMVFTVSSSFTPANGQLGGTETITSGDCVARYDYEITDIQVVNGEVTGTLQLSTGQTAAITLTEATCTSLAFQLNSPLEVYGVYYYQDEFERPCRVTLEDITWISWDVLSRKGGGQMNLIYNSLCSIAHLLGTKASDRAIKAHFDNLFKRTAQ